jgi:Secretion system C-terminal sorting domain
MVSIKHGTFLFALLCLTSVSRGQTLVLQPSAADGEDVVLASCVPCGYADTNYGTVSDFAASGWTNQSADSDLRSLIRFDLTMLPAGTVITGAHLSFYFNPTSSNGEHSTLSGSNAALLQRVTAPWSEAACNWNNQPTSTTTGEVFVAPTTTPSEDRPDIDVTAAVQDMVNNPGQNFGWMLRVNDETGYRRMVFASSDHPDGTLHPKLVVDYSSSEVTCINMGSGALEVKDALLASCIPCGYNNTNFGTSPDVVAAGWTNGGAASDGRSLIEFELQAIPAYAQPISATLSLYFDPTSSNGEHSTLSGSNQAWLQRVLEPWVESQVTWDNQPGVTSEDQVYVASTTTPNEDRPSIDVLPLVQVAVSDMANYHGWLLRLDSEDAYRRMVFASSDHVDPFRHPKLEVCYTLTVGQDEIHDQHPNITVYPDPFTDHAVIDLSSFGNRPLDISLIDVNGRMVRSLNSSGDPSIIIERADLPSGIYSLHVFSMGGSMGYARFVID